MTQGHIRAGFVMVSKRQKSNISGSAKCLYVKQTCWHKTIIGWSGALFMVLDAISDPRRYSIDIPTWLTELRLWKLSYVVSDMSKTIEEIRIPQLAGTRKKYVCDTSSIPIQMASACCESMVTRLKTTGTSLSLGEPAIQSVSEPAIRQVQTGQPARALTLIELIGRCITSGPCPILALSCTGEKSSCSID